MTKAKIATILILVILALLLFWAYRRSPRKIEFLGHYHKIGAHRVNSVEKLEKTLPYFSALELDLVYLPETDALDVNHPPTPSMGLTFTNYAKALGNERPFLWLDIKNLSHKNAPQILQKLNGIFNALQYPKDQILIETRYPLGLDLFAESGYKTSYYLEQNLRKMSKTSLDEKIVEIQRVLDEQPGVALSTVHFDYEVLQEHFPATTKYFWCLRRFKIGDYSLVRTMLKDSTVALVLTTYRPF